MGLLVLLIGTPLGTVAGCGQAGNPSPAPGASGPMQAQVIVEGTFSQIPQDQEVVFEDQASWEAFYRRHDPQSQPPTVDFTRHQVVGVVLKRNTGGFTVALDEVREGPDRVVVAYTETQPSPDAVTIQVLTQPFFFATITRRDLPVTFEHRVETAPTP